jgi:hypothetical protein
MRRRTVLGGADVVHGAAAAATAARVRWRTPTTKWALIPSPRCVSERRAAVLAALGARSGGARTASRSGDATPAADCRLDASCDAAAVTLMEVVAKHSITGHETVASTAACWARAHGATGKEIATRSGDAVLTPIASFRAVDRRPTSSCRLTGPRRDRLDVVRASRDYSCLAPAGAGARRRKVVPARPCS